MSKPRSPCGRPARPRRSRPAAARPHRKRSTVRHERAVQVDRTHRLPAAPPAAAFAAHLACLLQPALEQLAPSFRQLGGRNRQLGWAVFPPVPLYLVWQQVGSAVALQLWATGILYAVLSDLSGVVAVRLGAPLLLEADRPGPSSAESPYWSRPKQRAEFKKLRGEASVTSRRSEAISLSFTEC